MKYERESRELTSQRTVGGVENEVFHTHASTKHSCMVIYIAEVCYMSFSAVYLRRCVLSSFIVGMDTSRGVPELLFMSA